MKALQGSDTETAAIKNNNDNDERTTTSVPVIFNNEETAAANEKTTKTTTTTTAPILDFTSMIDRSLCLIAPCPVEDAAILPLLARIDAKLERRWKRFQQLVQQNDASVRPIQGDRYEVFVRAKEKPSTAFDEICVELAKEEEKEEETRTALDIKTTFLQFATKQAAKDTRFPAEYYAYNNFSLLVTFGAVRAQSKHLDLLWPNGQFGLMLSDNRPGTITFPVPYDLATPQDLQKHIKIWKKLPDDVAQVMQDRNTNIPKLLKDFGNTLHVQLQPVVSDRLCRGTVCGLPGSVVHAGPPCQDYRAIMFFSAWPVVQKKSKNLHDANNENGLNYDDDADDDDDNDTVEAVEEYDPDTQYFGALLVAESLPELWWRVSESSRLFLLKVLDFYMRQEKSIKNIYRHLHSTSMCHELMWALETQDYKHQNMSKEEYMVEESKAQRARLTLPRLDSGEEIPLYRLEKVSLGKLYTNYRGAELLVAIYKILPPDVAELQSHGGGGDDQGEKESQAEEDDREDNGADQDEDDDNNDTSLAAIAGGTGYSSDEARGDKETLKEETGSSNVTRNILIFYREDGSWEGCCGTYTLEMKPGQERTFFFGGNGYLKDGDGATIEFHERRNKSSKKKRKR